MQPPRRRRSIRLPAYDYAGPGAYFVTIVTHHRLCLFGEVLDQEMHLNNVGLIASSQWQSLPRRFPNVELGAFVVMPNHIHGILIIRDGRGTAENIQDSDDGLFRRAPTEAFGHPIAGSIPTIVRSYKSAVSYRINLMRGMPGAVVWQRNYYEHVIRDQEDWERIHRYIESNPSQWVRDEENPQREL